MKNLIQLPLIRTVATILCVAALSMPVSIAYAASTGASGGGSNSGGGDKSGGRGGNASHSGSDRNGLGINDRGGVLGVAVKKSATAKVTSTAVDAQLAPSGSVDAHLAPNGATTSLAPNGATTSLAPNSGLSVSAAPRAPRAVAPVAVQAPSLTADSCAKPAHINNEYTCELTTHRE